MKLGAKTRGFAKYFFYKYRMGSESQQLSEGLVVGSFSEESNDRSSHSIITMDSASRQSGMAKLEAELEAELERMQCNIIAESSSDTEISDSEMADEYTTIEFVHGGLNSSGFPGKKDNNAEREVPFPNYGISPIELERRLHELLERRQEEQIEELNAKLKITEDKLLAKEMELSWWKERAFQFPKTSIESTDMPGNESNVSIATDGEPSRHLYTSKSHQDNEIQEMNIVYDAEHFSSSVTQLGNSIKMKCSQQRFVTGNKSNVSIATDGEPSRHLYTSKSHQDNVIQEMNIVYDAEHLSSSISQVDNSIKMKCSQQRFVDREKPNRKSSLNEDWKTTNNSKSTRDILHSNSDLELNQSPTCSDIHTLQPAHCNGFGEGNHSERKESHSLFTMRKDGFLNKFKTESSACHPELSMGNHVFQCNKRHPPPPCFSKPIGSCKGNRKIHRKNSTTLQSVSHDEISEVRQGNGIPMSPVLSKIQQWEALSRGESCALPSLDLNNEIILPSSSHALASATENGDSMQRQNHQLETSSPYCFKGKSLNQASKRSHGPYSSPNCFKGKSLDHASERSNVRYGSPNCFQRKSLDHASERSNGHQHGVVFNKPEKFMVG